MGGSLLGLLDVVLRLSDLLALPAARLLRCGGRLALGGLELELMDE